MQFTLGAQCTASPRLLATTGNIAGRREIDSRDDGFSTRMPYCESASAARKQPSGERAAYDGAGHDDEAVKLLLSLLDERSSRASH